MDIVIILHQYPRARLCPNISAMCLAVETALRINKIDYKVKDNFKWNGVNPSLPKIEANSQKFKGAKSVFSELKSILNESDTSLSSVLENMVQDHLVACLELERYCYKTWNEYNQLLPHLVPNCISWYNYYKWKRIGKKMLQKQSKCYNAIGRLNLEQLQKLACDCIKVLSDQLGTSQFMLNGKYPSFVDFVIFGATTQILFATPVESPLRKFLVKHPNLLSHHSKIKSLAFPDWTQLTCENR